MTQLLPPKKEVALALLERSNVDVYLDPRAQGVVVPPQFRKEPRLILKIGLNMPVPIPDLRVDDESMSCTLSFNRAKFFCVVPWQSVFAMVGDDGRGMVWPDDVPQELSVRAEDRPLSPLRDASAPAPATAQTATVTPLPISAPTPSSLSSASPSTASGRAKGKSRIQPDAPPREASTASAGRAKRPRKKKEEATRPVLHAVPPPAKSAPRVEKLDDRRESRDAAARESREGGNAASDRNQGASADHVERVPPAPRAAGTNGRGRPTTPARPKRELPPYLRVVK